MNEAPIAPVKTSVTVPVTPARAYQLFTRDMGAWWPLSTHSVGTENSLSVTFGVAVGDAIVETMRDGTTAVWGSLVELDPPHRVAFNWHAGRSSDAVTFVEVTFRPEGGDSTIVELVHSGWERWSDGATQATAYQEGWPPVLDAYVQRASGDRG